MKTKSSIYLVLLFFSSLILQAQQNPYIKTDSNGTGIKSLNNIAIATVGDSLNSEISAIAGRSPYYLIFDKNGIFQKSIENPALSSGGSASPIVIDLLIQESCNAVIAGNFGDKMLNQLKWNKIEYYERDGIANEVLQAFLKKEQSNK